ncbi:MAG: hypothetical protein AAF206_01430 [Bacteroidota bacterium]
MTPKRIVLLGGSGQIGRPSLQHLIEQFPDAQVVGSSRSAPTGDIPPQHWMQFDPFKDEWGRLGRADVLINCIGQIREEQLSFADIHLGLTQKILTHRVQLGMPRIIQLSALGAGQHPNVPFLATKAQADALLLKETDTYVVRPSIVWTPNTMLLRKLRQLLRISRWLLGHLFVPEGFLQASVQPIQIDPLTHVMAALCKGLPSVRIIDAVGPRPQSFGELLETERQQQSQNLRIHEIPRQWLDPLVLGFVARFFPGIINADQYQLLFADNVGDPSKMEALLSGSHSS